MPSVKDHSLKVQQRRAQEHTFLEFSVMRSFVTQKHTENVNIMQFSSSGICLNEMYSLPDTHQCWHLPPPSARCCCSVKHKNAPVHDYGVTLVHSPRQPGWLLTGNPGATRHLGVEAWKMFCMLQQSLWSQSGKKRRWFLTQQLSSVCKVAVSPLSCRGFIVIYVPDISAVL